MVAGPVGADVDDHRVLRKQLSQVGRKALNKALEVRVATWNNFFVRDVARYDYTIARLVYGQGMSLKPSMSRGCSSANM